MNAVVIATYNERPNAPPLVRQLRELYPELQIVVVDDDSPDGTAEALREIGDERLTVLCRKNEKGYGTAVCAGLIKACALGAERVATMDSDFSHDPKALSSLLDALHEADMAIGSRYIGGVRVLNWAAERLLLSLFANFYVRTILGLSARDCTSGFRAYRRSLLKRMRLRQIDSNGYSFLVEMLWRAKRSGAAICEVPIVFEERREGESKMDGGVIRESVLRPWLLRLKG